MCSWRNKLVVLLWIFLSSSLFSLWSQTSAGVLTFLSSLRKNILDKVFMFLLIIILPFFFLFSSSSSSSSSSPPPPHLFRPLLTSFFPLYSSVYYFSHYPFSSHPSSLFSWFSSILLYIFVFFRTVINCLPFVPPSPINPSTGKEHSLRTVS